MLSIFCNFRFRSFQILYSLSLSSFSLFFFFFFYRLPPLIALSAASFDRIPSIRYFITGCPRRVFLRSRAVFSFLRASAAAACSRRAAAASSAAARARFASSLACSFFAAILWRVLSGFEKFFCP